MASVSQIRRMMQMATPHQETVTDDAVASFATDFPAPARVTAEFSPVQDLHGYDAPWPAGGGKNLMPYPAARDVTFSNVRFVSDGKGKITVTGTASGNNDCGFWFSMFTIPDGSAYKICLLNNQAVNGSLAFTKDGATIDTWSFSSVNREENYTGMSNKECNGIRMIVYSGVTYNLTFHVMFVPTSTTVTGYIPYENYCPITGWTDAEVTRAGKNLSSFAVSPRNPDVYWGTDFSELKAVLNSLPVGQYTISNKFKVVTVPSDNTLQHGRFYITAMVNGTQQVVLSYVVQSDTNAYAGKVYEERGTFTITEAIKGNINHCYGYCKGSGGKFDIYDIQIELGSTANAYEAYHGQTIAIDWEDEAGTQYGGYFQLNEDGSGVLVSKYKLKRARSSSDATVTTRNGQIATRYYNFFETDEKCITSEFAPNTNIISGGVDITSPCITKSTRELRVCIPGWSATEINTYFANNEVYVLIELATPITYPLTADQIKTLLGENCVFSNLNSSVTVRFFKHG